jgi:hypothetical protein
VELKEILDKTLEIYHSDKNKKRLEKWISQDNKWWDHARAQFHGIPRPISELNGQVPISIYMLNSVWSEKLGINLENFYKDPEEYLKNYLLIKINRFQLLDDDTPIDNRIRIWFGAVLGASLFGSPIRYYEHADPVLGKKIIIEDAKQLSKMKRPNFYTSGIMPTAIRFYERISELVGKDFKVLFPQWIRSPFGVALELRGFENLLIDLKADPDFVKQVFDFIAEVRIDWSNELKNYLDVSEMLGDLYNDEIQADMIGNDAYRDLILPSEKKLDDYYNGIGYWHSCGQIHPIVKDIVGNLNIDLFDIGPYNDKTIAIENLASINPRQNLELRFNPLIYIQPKEANLETMKERIGYILSLCKSKGLNAYTFKVSALQVQYSIENIFAKVRMWIKACREVIESDCISQ